MDEIVITTEAERDAALDEVEYLMGKDKLTDRENGYMSRLLAAIDKFEEEYYK